MYRSMRAVHNPHVTHHTFFPPNYVFKSSVWSRETWWSTMGRKAVEFQHLPGHVPTNDGELARKPLILLGKTAQNAEY